MMWERAEPGWDGICAWVHGEHRTEAGGGGEDAGGSTVGQADSWCLCHVPVDVRTRLAHMVLGTISVWGERRGWEASEWRGDHGAHVQEERGGSRIAPGDS